MRKNKYRYKLRQLNPETSHIGNVTSLPRNVSTFQSDLKGFGKKYLPLMNLRPFKESIQLFRNLQEGLPGGKLVKKSQIMNPSNPDWDPSKHLGRSIPNAVARLKSLRK